MELDAKLSAWMSAVGELQAQIIRAAKSAETPAPSTASKPPQEVPATPSASPPSAAAKQMPEPAGSGRDGLDTRTQATNTNAAATGIITVGQNAGPNAEPGTVTSASADVTCVGGEERGQPAAKANEDEALLASLDEQTAAAIRVMRRLNPSGLSVRELLAQYQATHQKTETKRSRGSWFSRGK